MADATRAERQSLQTTPQGDGGPCPPACAFRDLLIEALDVYEGLLAEASQIISHQREIGARAQIDHNDG